MPNIMNLQDEMVLLFFLQNKELRNRKVNGYQIFIRIADFLSFYYKTEEWMCSNVFLI